MRKDFLIKWLRDQAGNFKLVESSLTAPESALHK